MSAWQGDPGRIRCARSDCAGVVEASVQLWLILHADGGWSVYGVGDETAQIICDAHEHDNTTSVLHKSLSAFLDELLPGATWEGSEPLPEPGHDHND
jgi:hypothetical protein